MGAKGGFLTQSFGAQHQTQVTLSVPGNAFASSENVSVTTTDVSTLSTVVAKGVKPLVAVGVNFAGANPKVPVTLVVTNPGIPAGAKVYKLAADGTLTSVQATVEAGRATITFSSDPNFIIASPSSSAAGQGKAAGSSGQAKLKPNQRIITLGGENSVVPAIVRGKTTYMPIWYVMHLLGQLNIHSTWDGHNWHMTTSLPVDVSNLQAGQGTMSMYFNGHLVQHVTGFAAVDPATGKETTYMPIWYVMKVLHRVNVTSHWDGTTWSMVKH